MSEALMKGLALAGAAAVGAGAALFAVGKKNVKKKRSAKYRKRMDEFCSGPCFVTFEADENKAADEELEKEIFGDENLQDIRDPGEDTNGQK